MKKLFVLACMLLSMTAAKAQWNEWNGKNILEHVGVGVGFGLSGITIDLGTDVTDYLTVRGGVDIFPSVDLDFDIPTGFDGGDIIGQANIPARYNRPTEDIKVKATSALGGGHLLFDIHPFKSAFRITAGLYFGKKDVITVDTKDDVMDGMAQWNTDVYNYATGLPKTPAEMTAEGHADLAQMALANGNELPRYGAEIGDYFLEPKADGSVSSFFRVSGVRPYVGLGFGRMVPKKSRLTCNVDLGVQFWGKPSVYLDGRNGETELSKSTFEEENDSEALDVLSKITVYPQLTVRLVGRIF